MTRFVQREKFTNTGGTPFLKREKKNTGDMNRLDCLLI